MSPKNIAQSYSSQPNVSKWGRGGEERVIQFSCVMNET